MRNMFILSDIESWWLEEIKLSGKWKGFLFGQDDEIVLNLTKNEWFWSGILLMSQISSSQALFWRKKSFLFAWDTISMPVTQQTELLNFFPVISKRESFPINNISAWNNNNKKKNFRIPTWLTSSKAPQRSMKTSKRSTFPRTFPITTVNHATRWISKVYFRQKFHELFIIRVSFL